MRCHSPPRAEGFADGHEKTPQFARVGLAQVQYTDWLSHLTLCRLSVGFRTVVFSTDIATASPNSKSSILHSLRSKTTEDRAAIAKNNHKLGATLGSSSWTCIPKPLHQVTKGANCEQTHWQKIETKLPIWPDTRCFGLIEPSRTALL